MQLFPIQHNTLDIGGWFSYLSAQEIVGENIKENRIMIWI
jgi:hypothetical protein